MNNRVPKEVMEELVGVSVSLNLGPPVTYFGNSSGDFPSERARNIDQVYCGIATPNAYFVSSNTLAEVCGYEGKNIAREWLLANLPDRWIMLPEELCEYQA
jgi:hypothetical protein